MVLGSNPMLNSPILVDYLSMGEQKMEQMTLPALFEHVRKIHQMASDSVVDQVFNDSAISPSNFYSLLVLQICIYCEIILRLL